MSALLSAPIDARSVGLLLGGLVVRVRAAGVVGHESGATDVSGWFSFSRSCNQAGALLLRWRLGLAFIATTVAAGYGLPARKLGTVSLIGPVRMDYPAVIATVREAAVQLSRYVEDVYDG